MVKICKTGNGSALIKHIVADDGYRHFWGRESLCGVKFTQRRYGWVKTHDEITCEKCLEKLNDMHKEVIILNESEINKYSHIYFEGNPITTIGVWFK